MRKLKKFMVLFSAAAIVLTSGSALAKVTYTAFGIWEHGTTGWFGGGQVYSRYIDYHYDNYQASVKNAKGSYAYDIETSETGNVARASLKAYVYKTDYSYYNFWN